MTKQIKFKDFTIIPIVDSAKRLKISDEEYFSKKYSNYISNSKLSYINPEQDGSPEKYHNGLVSTTTTSLALGSAVHELTLQPESFTLADKCNKPTAKLGMVIDRIKVYRKNYTIYDSIVKACNDVNYYVNSIDSHISDIIKKGLKYYLQTKDLDESVITLDDKMHTTCVKCVTHLKECDDIQNTLFPTDVFGDKLPSFNEDAMFMDFVVMYDGKATILKFKAKADNWTIDVENKTLTLNDLKTTGKPVAWFMNPEYGSFKHYKYARQLALYGIMLQNICKNEYGFNKNWTMKYNIAAVETIDDCNAALFPISDNLIKSGKRQLAQLMSRVAYYQMFGWDSKVEFI